MDRPIHRSLETSPAIVHEPLVSSTPITRRSDTTVESDGLVTGRKPSNYHDVYITPVLQELSTDDAEKLLSTKINPSTDMIRFKWITDPYADDNDKIQEDIIRALHSAMFTIISNYSISLYQGIVETEYIVKINRRPSTLVIDSVTLEGDRPEVGVYEAIGKIAYEPLTFTMEKQIDFDANTLAGARSVVEEFTKLETGVDVTSVDYTYMDGENISYVSFQPRADTTLVYQNKDIILNITSKLNLNEISGYHALSSDPITKLAIEEYASQDFPLALQSGSTEKFKIYHNIFLVKIDQSETPVDFQFLQERIMMISNSLRIDGHFTLPPDPRLSLKGFGLDQQTQDIYLEIARLWRGEVIRTGPPMVIRSEVDFSIPSAVWYHEAANSILNLEIPRYVIRDVFDVRWQRTFTTDRAEVRIRLSFIAIKAYSVLITRFPVLAPYYNTPIVRGDLSIEAAFSSYDEVEVYREILKGEMYNGSHSILSLKLVPVKNIVDGVAVRWYFRSYRKDLDSLVVEVDQNLYVLLDSRISKDIPPVDRSPDGMSKYRGDLETALKSYYQICDTESSDVSVSREDVNDMSLERLLELVPIYQHRNSVSFDISRGDEKARCVRTETLDKIPVLIDPTTGNPLLEETITIYRDLEWGYRGYFPVGPFNGLLPKPPVRHNIRPDIGVPVITQEVPAELSIDNDIELLEKIGQTFVIEIAFHSHDFLIRPNDPPSYQTAHGSTNLRSSEEQAASQSLSQASSQETDTGLLIWLADLVLPGASPNYEEELGELTLNLWNCGWFLTDWATSLYFRTKRMSRTHFIIHQDVYRGGDSMVDGLKALRIFRMIDRTTCSAQSVESL